MVLFAVALMAAVLGFGSGVLVSGVRRDRRDARNEPPRILSSVKALMDQARWLPVARIIHRRCDENGFPSVTGRMVPILELEGNIRLIAGDRPLNSAFLEYNGTRIGLNPDDRAWLGNVFSDRVAELAIGSAETKLLEL